MNGHCLNDQEMLNDVLSTQKFISGGYNTSAGEAASPTVKNAMMSLLEEEHAIQHEIFCEMQSRGWYQTQAAEQNKIDQAKTKFSCQCNPCCC